MIDRREIRDSANTFGLRPQVVEKDYVLGWVLAGIYQHTALRDTWIFRGGTCLKKCYFETYRFSEDLDFTVTDTSQINQEFLGAVFGEIGHWVYERTGIEIPQVLQNFDLFENPRGSVSCQGKLSYRGPIAPRSGGLPRIKLDLTLDELLVLPPVERVIFHDYSDALAEGIMVRCYAYEEAFAEKARALGDRVLELLAEARMVSAEGGLVFPSPTGRLLSDSTISKLVRENGIKAVPHGFRSSFRDWCGETGQPREVAEAALAHSIANKTESAYARSDLFERRRTLMRDWTDYVTNGAANQIEHG